MSSVFFLDVLPATADAAVDYAATVHRDDAGRVDLLDFAVTRGDGVFETLGVVDRRVHARAGHLNRLAHSAALLDLPAPNLAQWAAAIDLAAQTLPDAGSGSIRLTLSRGVPGGGPSGWAVATPVSEQTARGLARARAEGIAVVLLERGISVHSARTAPWLLTGAKTLSYAINMAALREAERRGAEDALFLSNEGYALEGPTSSLLVRVDGGFLSPPVEEAILEGTTLNDAFAWLRAAGQACEFGHITRDILERADGVWLLSSLRLAAPVRSLDNRTVPMDAELTAELNAALERRAS